MGEPSLIDPEGSLLKPAAADKLKQIHLKERLDGLRGMAWAYGVLHHTGYTASGASKRFSPPNAGGNSGESLNSKLMYRYLNGESAPTRGPRGKYGYDLVTAVDADPRTRPATKWLDHPLWRIFHPDTTYAQLEPYRDEEALPVKLLQGIYTQTRPFEKSLTESDLQDFNLEIFDDFLCICTSFRVYCNGDMRSIVFPLIEYLTPQAALIEPIFGYVQAPFLKMLKDFYYGSPEEVRDRYWREILIPLLQTTLQPLLPELQFSWLYGPEIRDDETGEGSINIMLISENIAFNRVVELLEPLRLKLGIIFQPQFFTPAEFREKLAIRDSYVNRVSVQSVVPVTGDVQEFIGDLTATERH